MAAELRYDSLRAAQTSGRPMAEVLHERADVLDRAVRHIKDRAVALHLPLFERMARTLTLKVAVLQANWSLSDADLQTIAPDIEELRLELMELRLIVFKREVLATNGLLVE